MQTNSNFNWVQTSWWLLSRATLLFPLEHTLELIKGSAQANPQLSSWKIIRQIYEKNGLKGFANTASITYPKRLLRETSRVFVIGNSHDYFIHRYPHIFKRNEINIKFVSVVMSTLFKASFIVPLEQLISFKIKEKKPYSEFFRERFAQDGISSLYKGWRVDLINQLAIWTILMGVDHYTKKNFDRYAPEDTHPYLRQGLTSVAVTASIVAPVLPINFIKTRIQMDRELQNKSIATVTKTLFRAFGMRGFYSGVGPVLINTLLYATFYGKIFDNFYTRKD